jgi:hypothetical protein
VAAGERFDQPSAARAAAARTSPDALAEQLARCRAEVAGL